MGYLDLYNQGNKSSYESIAYDIFVTKLLQDKRTGSGKAGTLEGMDMEKDAPAAFVPSMFYTFIYMSPSATKGDASQFIDSVPLVLCLSNSGSTISGINFNLLPNNVRASVLDIIKGTNESFYKKPGKEFAINEGLAKVFVDSPSEFIKAVKEKTGVNISGAVRNYNIKYMKTVRMVEYDQWQYIPFLCFKDAVRGVNLAVLQKQLADSQDK